MFLESYIFISEQNLSTGGNRNCLFISLGIQRVARWIISFVLEVFVIISPYYNWMMFLCGQIQSPRPDVMPEGFVAARIETPPS